MTESTNKPFFKTLWDRKVPQYLGTYFAVGFGLLQFVEFITKRYGLNSALVDKYLLVWLALVPAIFVLIYFGGQLKFKSTNLKWPKIFVTSNVLLAFLLGGFLFNNNSDAQSTTVELKDEEGKTINAIVPELNKIKAVAIFQFENLTGDKDNDWYGVAFSQLLHFNLEQSPDYYISSVYELNGYYDFLSIPSFTVPNVGIQREIAKQSRSDYFSRISYNKEENQFVFKGNLYNSSDGKHLLEFNFKNKDPFAAIDQIKQKIYDALPKMHVEVENKVNLPASALITGNIEALKYLTLSRIAYYNNPTGLKKVVELAEKSIEFDPTCAICHYWVGDPLYGSGQRDEAITYVKNAVKYGASLPERMQFRAKETLYSITNQMDSYWKLQEVRRKMFPYEFHPYEKLIGLYKSKYGIDSTKTLIKEAIDNGNVEKGLLAQYELQLENEDFEDAKNTLDRFSNEFPDRDQDRVKYADLNEKQGNIQKAKEILLEEATMQPLNGIIQARLASLEFKNVNISQANDRVDRMLVQATTITDSLNALFIKSQFLINSGQIKNAFSTMRKFEELAVKRMPINRLYTSTYIYKVNMYQSIGEKENIKGLLATISEYSPEFISYYRCLANFNAMENDYKNDFDKEGFAECRENYKSLGEGYEEYLNVLELFQAGDYEKCVRILDNKNSKVPDIINNTGFLAKIYDLAGEKVKAQSLLKKEIDRKTDEPSYYYQMSILLENENPTEAKKYLDIALKFWENADSNYIPFQRAMALSQRLEQNAEKIEI